MTTIDLQSVSRTLLIPLYLRAVETRRQDALLKDAIAEKIIDSIEYDFSSIKLQGHDVLGLILRVREFDRFVRNFMVTHPRGIVVHIGCGLDTRYERVDNGAVEWYDMDLPDVIQLRRELIHGETDRYHLLEQSVFDPAWMEKVSCHLPGHFLFVAEGVFPYFKTAQITNLVNQLCLKFPGSELVFDASKPWVIPSDNMQLFFSGIKARLHFGLQHGRDIETWHKGIQMLEEWFYFGTQEDRVRKYHWMYNIPFLRKSVGIFHYRLGNM